VEENTLEGISFISNLGEIGKRPGIPSVEGGLAVRPFAPVQLANETVRKAVDEAIKGLAHYLDSLAKEDGGLAFCLEEVELTVQVSQTGKVNVFLANVGGEVEGGMKLKWKRREGKT